MTGISLTPETASGYGGILLPHLDIGLDVNYGGAKHIFISHGHADHVPNKLTLPVYATSPTAAFMRVRGFTGTIIEVPFYESVNLPHAQVRFFPAGHILGSAMVLIESSEGNLLYSGDYRSPASPTTEGFVWPEEVPIDVFITEATFGLPIYKWEPHEVYQGQMHRFVQKCMAQEATPVFVGYNLGKAQEILHLLAPLNIPVMIHANGFPLCKIYETFGVNLGSYCRLNMKETAGHIVVIPGSSTDSQAMNTLPKQRLAYVSGWASHEALRQQMNVDERIALSDHSDFYELLRICQTYRPKEVLITHSPQPEVTSFLLQQKGFNARPLWTKAIPA